jgi:hypothetical protein
MNIAQSILTYLFIAGITKYGSSIPRAPQCLSPCPNWDPTPSPESEGGGGGTGSQMGRLEKKPSTLVYSVAGINFILVFNTVHASTTRFHNSFVASS